MWFKKRPDLSVEQEEAERILREETLRFEKNRYEHHKLVALSPMETLRAYVILAEKGGKK